MITSGYAEVSGRCAQGACAANPDFAGFAIVREREHIAMIRPNPDGSKTPLTLPNHARLKGSTLRVILRQSNIPRDDFLSAYEHA